MVLMVVTIKSGMEYLWFSVWEEVEWLIKYKLTVYVSRELGTEFQVCPDIHSFTVT